MISVRYNKKQLEGVLNSYLSKAADPEIMKRLGASTIDLVNLGFHDSKDPYGSPWKKLAHPNEAGKPLRDKGLFQNSFSYKYGKNFMEVGTTACFAHIHQFGATITAKPGDAGSNACGTRKGARAVS